VGDVEVEAKYGQQDREDRDVKGVQGVGRDYT
jgi:hypothetical protein